MNAKQALGALYQALIGYNPFEDDPTCTAEEILDVLKTYPERQDALFPAIWAFDRMDFDIEDDLEREEMEIVQAAIAAVS